MLAEHLELSQTTVSLVLNNSPSAKSIPPETRQRVMEAAERLNYRPNYFARSLRQSRSMSVGVLAPDLSEGYFTRVMSGVVEELTAAHYFYFTACHDWKKELIEQYPRMLVERAVDGFLLLNTPCGRTSRFPCPVVAISAHSAVENVTNIVLDHHAAVEQALKHLYELGHRKIAFMRGPKAIPDSEYRWESIQEVAREIGLKIDPANVIRIDTAGWSMKAGIHPMAPEIGYKPMKALLEKTPRLHRHLLLQRHRRHRRHPRPQGRGLLSPGRCFRGRLRRHPVRRLLHALAHHGASAADGDGPKAAQRFCSIASPIVKRNIRGRSSWLRS